MGNSKEVLVKLVDLFECSRSIWKSLAILSFSLTIDHEIYELDFPKENSKTIQEKRGRRKNISKTKMKIYSVFMLHTRFMMGVFTEK